MKRAITLLLAAIMLLSLAACGGGGSTTTPSATPEQGEPTDPSAEVTAPEEEPESPGLAVTELSNGDSVKLDFVEMTIGECGIKAEVLPDYLPNGMKIYGRFDAREGKQYVFVKGTIKGLATSAIDLPAITGTVMLGDYSYKVDTNGNGEVMFFSQDWKSEQQLEPLTTLNFFIAASVPDELADSHDSCVLTFGFKDMFDSDGYQLFFADDPLSECDYVYSVDIDANAGIVNSGDTAESNAQATEISAVAEELALGQTYTTDDYEVTISSLTFNNKAEVIKSSGSGFTSKSTATATAGSTFILIESSVKYLGTEEVRIKDAKPFSAYALYNGTYRYEEHFTFVGSSEITPLQTLTQVLPVEIPEDVELSEEPLLLFITIGATDYQYAIR